MNIRPATPEDLDAIMRVEKQSFGEGIAPDAMATREQMASRIAFFKEKEFPEGFLLAEHNAKIVGYIISFPTELTPKQYTSWRVATDAGNIRGTFDSVGRHMLVVSLAVISGAPSCTMDSLAHKVSVTLLDRTRKFKYHEGFCMFCARMPGFLSEHEKTNVAPEKYWKLEDSKGRPKDPLLRIFYEMTGAKPGRLLIDGYPPDHYSGGHGVLFVVEDIVLTIRQLELRICQK